MLSSATTWGIDGPAFLWGYAGLAAVAGLLAGWRWRAAMGPEAGTEHAELDPTRLALLSGGPQLAVTTVAATLHQAGVLRAGGKPGTLVADGTLGPDAASSSARCSRRSGANPGSRPGRCGVSCRAVMP
jgi:uncharacterized protein (TIGR04222 family)